MAAEKQIKPFIAVGFGGSTTIVDFERAAGTPATIIGVGAAVLGDLVGLDIDVARAPGFFQSGDQTLVLASSVTTVTGNIVLTLPRRMTEYSLRPYFVAGGGVMRVYIDDSLGALPISETLATMDLGGGVTGFVTNRIGLCWEVRRFRSFSRKPRSQGVSIGPEEQLSFWRASMALAIRY